MNAFSYCSALSTIILSNGLKYIESNSFRGTNISTLFIPSTVIHVAKNAFASVTTLTCHSITSDVFIDHFNENVEHTSLAIDIDAFPFNLASKLCSSSPIALYYQSTIEREVTSNNHYQHRRLAESSPSAGRPNLKVEITSAFFGKRADPISGGKQKRNKNKEVEDPSSSFSPILKLKLKVFNPSVDKDFVVFPQELTPSTYNGRKVIVLIYY